MNCNDFVRRKIEVIWHGNYIQWIYFIKIWNKNYIKYSRVNWYEHENEFTTIYVKVYVYIRIWWEIHMIPSTNACVPEVSTTAYSDLRGMYIVWLNPSRRATWAESCCEHLLAVCANPWKFIASPPHCVYTYFVYSHFLFHKHFSIFSDSFNLLLLL